MDQLMCISAQTTIKRIYPQIIKSSQDDSSYSDTNSTLSDVSPSKPNQPVLDCIYSEIYEANNFKGQSGNMKHEYNQNNSSCMHGNTSNIDINSSGYRSSHNESYCFQERNTELDNVNTTLSLMNASKNNTPLQLKDEVDCKSGVFSVSPLTPLIPLEPLENFKAEDYLFSLDSSEGINDLFDMDSFL